jgi:hypothetical protein
MADKLQFKGEWRFAIENSFVRNSEISVAARMLYIILRGYVGPSSPVPFPKIATLCAIMGCHRNSIQKYLIELESFGLLDRKQRHKPDGSFSSNAFTLLPPSPLHKNSAAVNLCNEEVPVTLEEIPVTETKGLASRTATSGDVPAVVFFEPSSKTLPASGSPKVAVPKRKTPPCHGPRPPRPRAIPTPEEYDEFIEASGCVGIVNHRPDLYDEMSAAGWNDPKGKPIKFWKAYVRSLEAIL